MSGAPSPFKAPGFVSVLIQEGELDTIVRVLASGKRCTAAGLRRRLEWFYRFRGIARPEDRAKPSNVVRLSDYRPRRDCERTYGLAVTAMLAQEDRTRSQFFEAIVERLEDELACALEMEQTRAQRKAKRRKARRGRE